MFSTTFYEHVYSSNDAKYNKTSVQMKPPSLFKPNCELYFCDVKPVEGILLITFYNNMIMSDVFPHF